MQENRIGRKAIAGAFVAILLAQGRALANADFPTVYTVEETPLKAAVSGTMLTFELYADSGCTALYATQAIAIDDTLVEKIKLFTPKDGTKSAKLVKIHATLGNVAPSGGSWLKVTGTGVTPSPADCQAQSGNAAGSVVSTSSMNGSVAPFGSTSGFTFVGTTTFVSLHANSIVTAFAEIPLGTSGPDANMAYGICYQPQAGGPLTDFSPFFSSAGISGTTRRPYAASGVAAPGAGGWNIGFCVDMPGPFFVDQVGGENGWVKVTE